MTRRKHTVKQSTVTYTGLAGKVVKRVDSFEEYGKVNVRLAFEDDTELIVVVAPQPPKITTAQLLRWKRGNSAVVRSYTKTTA